MQLIRIAIGTTTLLLAACSVLNETPSASNVPCRIYAHNLSGGGSSVTLKKIITPKNIPLLSGSESKDQSIFIYKTTQPFSTGDVYLPIGTELAAKLPWERCKYHTVFLDRIPNSNVWLPAQGVVMPDKRTVYFTMITLPIKTSSQNNIGTLCSPDGKAVVPKKH